MLVSINQPAYLPWLGYFQRIAKSDLHIVLDHVQFEKNSFTNRNKVRTSAGWCWLTVPVLTKGRFGDLPINTLEINTSTNWADKHWKTIRACYGRAPHFSAHEPFFESIFSRNWTLLSDLCSAVTGYLLEQFRIETKLLYSSEMGVGGKKSDLILNLCREVGADAYLSGPLGRNYLDEAAFAKHGIEVRYHDYIHPVYPQVYEPFEPYMAAIDLLFNAGDRAAEIVRGGPS